MNLYRALARDLVGRSVAAWSDCSVCNRMCLLTPAEILHVEQARHFGRLVQSGPCELWALLKAEGTWLQQAQVSVRWVHSLVGLAGFRPTVELVQLDQVEASIRATPAHWKNAVDKAIRRAVAAKERQSFMLQWEDQFVARLGVAGVHVQASAPVTWKQNQNPCACVQCGQVFHSKRAAAVHAHRAHKLVTREHQLAQGTVCLVCLTQCHDSHRLKRHLVTHPQCTDALENAEIRPEKEGKSQEKEDGAFKPQVLLEGPRPWWATLRPPAMPPDSVADHMEEGLACAVALQAWVHKLNDCLEMHHASLVEQVSCLVAVLKPHAQQGEACWTMVCDAMDMTVKRAMEELSADVGQMIRRVARVAIWQLDPNQPRELRDFELGVRACRLTEGKVVCLDMWTMRLADMSSLPRKGTIVLHLFAGHRRAGDLQMALEEASRHAACGLDELTVLSVDLAISSQCDLLNEHNRATWLRLIKEAWVALRARLGRWPDGVSFLMRVGMQDRLRLETVSTCGGYKL